MKRLSKSIRRLRRNQKGATAVEFALLIGPFLFLLLGLLEVSMHYFMATALDYSLQRTARLVRTGQAQNQSFSASDLKAALCGEIGNVFDCGNKSYITVAELNSFSASSYTLPVDNSGNFITPQAPDLGVGGSYIIVRAFFQFSPLFDIFGALTPRLNNGNHLLVSSALFRNEPF
jgi:hypothetical protein